MTDAPAPSERDVGRQPPDLDLAELEKLISSSQHMGVPDFAPQFRLIRELGRSSPAALTQPLVLTIGRTGRLLVLEQPSDGGFRLVELSLDGSAFGALAEFSRGSGEADLLQPASIAIDEAERVYVLDAAGSALKRFSIDGRWLDTFSTAGAGGSALAFPRDFVLDAAGSIYIADTNNDRVAVLSSEGEMMRMVDRFAGSEPDQEADLYEPRSVGMTPDGGLLVADSNHNRVLRFDRDGARVVVGGKQLEFPTCVRPAPDGRSLYVADRGGVRVQRFSWQGERNGLLSAGSEKQSEWEGTAGFAIDAQGCVVMINPVRESVLVLDFVKP